MPKLPTGKRDSRTCSARNEIGRVNTLQATIGFLKDWLEEVETEESLSQCIVRFAQGRGYTSMVEVCRGMSRRYQEMAVAQDEIGWKRFMEGIISKRLVCL